MKTTLTITDKYNQSKVWIIKRYACGTYYLNQSIDGHIFYKRFAKTTLKHIKSILDVDIKINQLVDIC